MTGGAEPYKTTARWNEESIPAAIRGRHNTKAGVWGLLRVYSGEIDLVLEEPARRIRVTPDSPGLIPPEEWHHVELVGSVEMQVEFYRDNPLG